MVKRRSKLRELNSAQKYSENKRKKVKGQDNILRRKSTVKLAVKAENRF